MTDVTALLTRRAARWVVPPDDADGVPYLPPARCLIPSIVYCAHLLLSPSSGRPRGTAPAAGRGDAGGTAGGTAVSADAGRARRIYVSRPYATETGAAA